MSWGMDAPVSIFDVNLASNGKAIKIVFRTCDDRGLLEHRCYCFTGTTGIVCILLVSGFTAV